MTAVDFLHSEYKRILGDVLVKPSQGIEIADALAQAKEMFEQQIIDAWSDGYDLNNSLVNYTPEQYYTETFVK
ncbi:MULTISPECIES: hypothetical protein [Flavobacterium]|uniref:Uncharacterized protein n=1 Tax=Flavobacterium keumense TaxID=1306518 RepID=A0ABY8N267_9FLAO|nr:MULTISPECIES: hypothetical protein [Flavobacterium]WGK93759.1 hypothetical protein MG292_06560 [Flavobacterium keumense]